MKHLSNFINWFIEVFEIEEKSKDITAFWITLFLLEGFVIAILITIKTITK